MSGRVFVRLAEPIPRDSKAYQCRRWPLAGSRGEAPRLLLFLSSLTEVREGSRVQRNRAVIQKSKITFWPLRPVGNGLDRSGVFYGLRDVFYFSLRPRGPLLFRSAGKGGKRGRCERPTAALRCSCISFQCSARRTKTRPLTRSQTVCALACLQAGKSPHGPAGSLRSLPPLAY